MGKVDATRVSRKRVRVGFVLRGWKEEKDLTHTVDPTAKGDSNLKPLPDDNRDKPVRIRRRKPWKETLSLFLSTRLPHNSIESPSVSFPNLWTR